ncbi:hypothetical protein C8J56DRAFT_879519 [Mycena floridula]|nr:hypothetical protein C8J56DRAFT_879519 [Mycena floridula]
MVDFVLRARLCTDCLMSSTEDINDVSFPLINLGDLIGSFVKLIAAARTFQLTGQSTIGGARGQIRGQGRELACVTVIQLGFQPADITEACPRIQQYLYDCFWDLGAGKVLPLVLVSHVKSESIINAYVDESREYRCKLCPPESSPRIQTLQGLTSHLKLRHLLPEKHPRSLGHRPVAGKLGKSTAHRWTSIKRRAWLTKEMCGGSVESRAVKTKAAPITTTFQGRCSHTVYDAQGKRRENLSGFTDDLE